MKKLRVRHLALALLAALVLLPAARVSAEAGIVFFGSTGLAMDGLKGFLGEKDPEDRIVLRTDESPTHLVFIWDSPDLKPRLTISDAKGALVADLDLANGNRVTLHAKGEFVCVLSRRSGSGHWFCVVLGAREWDAR